MKRTKLLSLLLAIVMILTSFTAAFPVFATSNVEKAETLIANYRENYNKQVKDYRRYVKGFPARTFLNMLGYDKQDYKLLDYNAPETAPQNLFNED